MNLTRVLFLSAMIMQLLFLRSYATDRFKTGDQVNVWAADGLPLKSQANGDGKNLTTIPYGQLVTVIGSDAKTLPVSIKVNMYGKTYNLKGDWLKVVYKGNEGYVFSGYLSKMPPLIKTKYGVFEDEEDYLKRAYGIKQKKIIKGKDAYEKTTIEYKNGAKYVVISSEGCSDVMMYLKNITYQEGLLVELVIHKDADAAEDFKVQQTKDGMVAVSYNACD